MRRERLGFVENKRCFVSGGLVFAVGFHGEDVCSLLPV